MIMINFLFGAVMLCSFDIMLDSDLKAYLIEVNHTPSFTTDTPLDYHIKHSLILDTLILVDTRSKTKSL